MKKTLFTLLIFTLLSIPTFFVYGAEPIKILLVPGHDNEVWGAQYGNMKEADMNLNLAAKIFNILKKDKRFEVHITRDNAGYTKEFADYFSHPEEIISFRDNAKIEMQKKVESGSFIKKDDTVSHNIASENASVILYGINKWANENKMDAVIHIHFNDYPRPNAWTVGKYRGFVVYLPDGQMPNFKESSLLASNIFVQLEKKYITSTYPKEKGGLMPGQSLIALGSNGSLLPSVRSLLIEYGYIYRFGSLATRNSLFPDMANRTVAGIKKYFSP